MASTGDENAAAAHAGVAGSPRCNIKIGMVSLGCPKNLADAEAMLGLLKQHGYGITPDAGEADLIIVNTCGFIDSAKKESIAAILEMADMKANGRCKALIATGCLTERYRASFQTELPEADAVLGTGEYGRICEVADRLAGLGGGNAVTGGGACPDAPRTVSESTESQRLGHLNAGRVLTNGGGYVYIKISEGCDNRCNYCVIPDIRGPYAERPKADIIAEARRLAADREIEAVLTAQDTTRYGSSVVALDTTRYGSSVVALDTTRYNTPNDGGLCGLVDGLSEIGNVKWIRILYAYPSRVDRRLVRRLAEGGKLLRYLDVPVQHASDAVLRGMGRHYGRSDLLRMVETLRSEVPGIVLRTTVMTGFPGEGAKEFEELLEFVEWAKFERLGVFAYSREEGAPAAKMAGQVPKKTADGRRAELLKVQAGMMSKAESGRVGRRYEAVVDAAPRQGRQTALVRTYAEAPEIDGQIRAKAAGDVKPGSFVGIKVTGADAKGLFGEIIAT